jgi:hypothetical protein
MAKAKKAATKMIRCYLCGHRMEVSARTMSTTCPGCHKAIKVEDVVIKSYLPVNDLQTCGHLKITRRGRVAAKRIQSGEGIDCEGTIEGNVETESTVNMGAKSSWKGTMLKSSTLVIKDGATLTGGVRVPWTRDDDE